MMDANTDILVFSTVDQLRRVLPSMDADGNATSSLECPRCRKRLPNRSARRLHLEKVHRVRDDVWPSLNTQLGAIGVAKADEHRLRFVCPVAGCVRKTVHASAKLLVQHFQKNHTDKQFGCPHGCRARFGLRRDLKYHLKRYHTEEPSLPKQAPQVANTQKAKKSEPAVNTFNDLYCLVPLKHMMRWNGYRRIAPKPLVASTSTQTEIGICKFDDFFHGEAADSGFLTAHTQTDEYFFGFAVPEQRQPRSINDYAMGRSFAHAGSQSNFGFESGGGGPITEDFSQQCSFISIPSEDYANEEGMSCLVAADGNDGYMSENSYNVYVVDQTTSDHGQQTYCRNCSATTAAVDHASIAVSTFQQAAEPYYQDSFAQTVYPQTVDFGTQYCGGGCSSSSASGFMHSCVLNNCNDDQSAPYYHEAHQNHNQQQHRKPIERNFVHVAVGPDFSISRQFDLVELSSSNSASIIATT